jgi:transposase
MKTLSLDFRKRIVAACDRGEQTQARIAERFEVSLGMVKKLLAQRRRTGDLAPRHRFSGRKPKITPERQKHLRELVRAHPDLTLEELRKAVQLDCTLPAIHYALGRMGLSLKKSRSGPRRRSGPMSARRANAGRRSSRA